MRQRNLPQTPTLVARCPMTMTVTLFHDQLGPYIRADLVDTTLAAVDVLGTDLKRVDLVERTLTTAIAPLSILHRSSKFVLCDMIGSFRC